MRAGVGRLPDERVANILGASPDAVARARRDHHMPSPPSSYLGVGVNGGYLSTCEYDKLLGKKSDADIARQYGVTRAAVRCRRVNRGIRPFKCVTPKRKPMHGPHYIGDVQGPTRLDALPPDGWLWPWGVMDAPLLPDRSCIPHCTRCGADTPECGFAPSQIRASGRGICRGCTRAYARRRYRDDVQHRVASSIRRRLREALQNAYKKSMWRGIVDLAAIIEHVGPPPGEGHHLDHIRPLASFDLNDHDQLIQAHRPENFQWLPAVDNMRKSDSWGGRPHRRKRAGDA